MQFEFDSTTVELPTSNYEPLPEGWYTVTVTGAESKPTKSGTGSYLKLEFTVQGPSGQGRKVFSNYNVRNENPTAEKIGREQLAELCRCIGQPRLTDTDQVIGASLQVKLKIRPASNGYEAQNEVKGHRATDGSAPPAAATSSAPATAAKPGVKSPPWAKK